MITIERGTEGGVVTENEMIEDIIMIRDKTVTMAITEIEETEHAHMNTKVLQRGNVGDKNKR